MKGGIGATDRCVAAWRGQAVASQLCAAGGDRAPTTATPARHAFPGAGGTATQQAAATATPQVRAPAYLRLRLRLRCGRPPPQGASIQLKWAGKKGGGFLKRHATRG